MGHGRDHHRKPLLVAVSVAVSIVMVTGMAGVPVSSAGAEQPPPADAVGRSEGGDVSGTDNPDVAPIEKARPAIRWWVRTLDAAAGGLRRSTDEQAALIAEVTALQAALVDLQDNGLAKANQRIGRLERGIVAAEQLRRRAEVRVAELDAQRKQVAVNLYLTGPVEQLDYAGALGHSSSLDRTRTMVAVNSGVKGVTDRLNEQRAEVERQARTVERRRQALDTERDVARSMRHEAEQLAGRVYAAQAGIEQAGQDMADRVHQAAKAQDLIVFLLMASGSPAHRALNPTLSILGPSLLDAQQLTAWFVTHTGGLANVGRIAALAGLYIEEGTAIGVRGDVAFVQAVLETGGFRFTGSHNYAGIGHCDSCPRGFAFDSERQGVRAQVQMLRAYADSDVTPEQLPGGTVPGVDVANLGVKGCCGTWWGLTGVWATALHYGGSILKLYEQAIVHAFANPPADPAGGSPAV